MSTPPCGSLRRRSSNSISLEAGEADLQGQVDELRDASVASWQAGRGVTPMREVATPVPEQLAAELYQRLIPGETTA